MLLTDMLPTTQVFDSVIVYHDGSRKFITKAQEALIFGAMNAGNKNIITPLLGQITFSAIAKVLAIKDFYDQYPDEMPDTRNTFDENYPEYSRGGNDQVRTPTENARKLMIEGALKSCQEAGKSDEETAKFLAVFTSPWSKKKEYWQAIHDKYKTSKDKNMQSWVAKAKLELKKLSTAAPLDKKDIK